MASYDLYHQILLIREGGYVDASDDKGGPTKYGITRPFLTDYYRSIGVARQATTQDIRDLTDANAKSIYGWYWKKCGCDKINAQGIAEFVFDFCVNSGGAEKVIQGRLGVTQDGVIGPNTIAKLNGGIPELVLSELKIARMRHLLKNIDNGYIAPRYADQLGIRADAFTVRGAVAY